jgi:prepilin-type N-terminal cleavage/methylation domain-containing protein
LEITKRENGFTLVELIVTIGIVVFLMALLFPSFRNYERRNNLEQSAEEVRSAILETKNYAMGPRAGAKNVDYYKIVFQQGDREYSIVEGSDSGTGTTVRTYSLPTNIKFDIHWDDESSGSGKKSIKFYINQQGNIGDQEFRNGGTPTDVGEIFLDSDVISATKEIMVSKWGWMRFMPTVFQ